MKAIIIFLVFVIAIGACKKQDMPQPDSNPLEQNNPSCTTSLICFPPLQADTTCVGMVMELGNSTYRPVANFACIRPNIFLGINQLWVNGSTPGGLKVVTLMMPIDIAVGEYPIGANTAYDLRYVPSGDFNFLPNSGTLRVVTHNMADRYIEGAFNGDLSLLSPPFTNIIVEEGCFRVTY